ncbi:MAG: 50S ribosomal protein L35 [Armatimonadota bacterium]
MPKSKSRQRRSLSPGAKAKTQKTAAKRVKKTGTGKVVVRHAFKGHLLTRKSERRKRRLRQPGVASAADRRAFERLVPG